MTFASWGVSIDTEIMYQTALAIGTSGYSFDDWVGPFYPPGTSRGDMLRHYAGHFGIVEINASYYRLLPEKTYARMLTQVGPQFEFVAKLYGDFTHKPGLDLGLVETFKRTLDPLRSAGRLTALLAQFPYAFRNSAQNRDKVAALGEAFGEYTLAVEFRHTGWNTPSTFSLLSENGLPYVVVDEPPLEGLMPPVVERTHDLAYVRFHGRNARDWWGGGADRYNYLYSEIELTEWQPKIEQLLRESGRTLVFFNNCCLGQAVRNAQLLQKMMSG